MSSKQMVATIALAPLNLYREYQVTKGDYKLVKICQELKVVQEAVLEGRHRALTKAEEAR